MHDSYTENNITLLILNTVFSLSINPKVCTVYHQLVIPQHPVLAPPTSKIWPSMLLFIMRLG